MSDYIYSLESHLNAEQNQLVRHWQEAATAANQNIYLAGGAMRDLLAGHPTRDLDFTIEGNPLALASRTVGQLGGEIVSQDDHRCFVEMRFASGLTAQIAMSRSEVYESNGTKPKVSPAAIQQDLQRRDFTINAIALALNRGAKGLLIDPANGLGSLESRELRTTNPYALYDDPVRLLRLIRLKHRLQFTVAERTARQFQNALEENLQRFVSPACLFEELRHLGDEPEVTETLRELESTGLLTLPKLNLAGVSKLEKIKKSLPLGVSGWIDGWRSLLIVLAETLGTREKIALYEAFSVDRTETEDMKKVAVHSTKLETSLKSATLRRPTQIYQVLRYAPPDEILYTLYHTSERVVQDRIRNYVQKLLPLAQEVTDGEVAAAGAPPGSPKFEKVRDSLITARLNARPKKPESEQAFEIPAGPHRGRRDSA